jgi:hypothetical protein
VSCVVCCAYCRESVLAFRVMSGGSALFPVIVCPAAVLSSQHLLEEFVFDAQKSGQQLLFANPSSKVGGRLTMAPPQLYWDGWPCSV